MWGVMYDWRLDEKEVNVLNNVNVYILVLILIIRVKFIYTGKKIVLDILLLFNLITGI